MDSGSGERRRSNLAAAASEGACGRGRPAGPRRTYGCPRWRSCGFSLRLGGREEREKAKGRVREVGRDRQTKKKKKKKTIASFLPSSLPSSPSPQPLEPRALRAVTRRRLQGLLAEAVIAQGPDGEHGGGGHWSSFFSAKVRFFVIFFRLSSSFFFFFVLFRFHISKPLLRATLQRLFRPQRW